MSKCEEYTKHRATTYIKYVRTRASTASPQLPSGVELGKRSNVEHSIYKSSYRILTTLTIISIVKVVFNQIPLLIRQIVWINCYNTYLHGGFITYLG
ncbi:hypothetical protein [Candidatus Sarmatiella mevalonica]|uniref:hypothetical protein n=1 Tax=Candidatus Sarmatiella mevalonica TaxID=2770581 RepID=UPI001921384B|nr:hypothetical protein [Candidatus Sarmatiella mevalonica]